MTQSSIPLLFQSFLVFYYLFSSTGAQQINLRLCLAAHVSHMLATLAFSHMLVEHIHWKTDTFEHRFVVAVQQYAIVHV